MDSLIKRVLSRLRQHPITLLAAFVGSTVIALSTFTDAVRNLVKISPSIKYDSLNRIEGDTFEPEYSEGYDYDIQQLKHVWGDEGFDGIWETSYSHGKYCLENTATPLAVRQRFIGSNSININVKPVSIEVDMKSINGSRPTSSAGLIHSYQNGNYYAFTLSSSGNYFFYKRNNHGYTTLLASTSSLIRPNASNKLTLFRRKDHFKLFVNDELVATVSDKELRPGLTGIIAMDIGRYCFDNFIIYKNEVE